MRFLTLLAATLVATLTASAQLPEYIPSDGLIAFYPMDGDAMDAGPHGLDGTLFGPVAAEGRNGETNGALSFNGNRMEVEHSVEFDSPTLTVSHWINSASAQRQVAIKQNVFQGAGLERFALTHRISGSNLIEWAIKESCEGAGAGWKRNQSSSSATDGSWHHVVGVIDDSETRVYLDGQLLQSLAIDPNAAHCYGGDIIIGQEWSGVNYDVDGRIDEVGFWNRAFTDEEVLNLYSDQSSAQVPDYVPTDGLVAWYPLDGDALDVSPNNHDGTPSNLTFAPNRFDTPDAAGSFNGINTFIELDFTSISNQVDVFSINAWVKTTDSHGPVVSLVGNGGDNFEFNVGILADIVQSPGKIGCLIRDVCCGTGNNLFGATINDDDWHMVSIVRQDNGVIQLYDNGQLTHQSGAANGGVLNILPQYSSIGSHQAWDQGGPNCGSCNSPDQRYLNGLIDDVGFWNKALSQAEITALFNAPSSVVQGCTDPAACNYNASATEDDGSCTHPPSFDLGEDVTLCAGETATLTLDLPGQEMLWSTGSTETEIAVTESGTYSVEAGTTVSPEATAVEFGPNQLGIMGPAAPELDLAGTSEVTLATWVKLNSNSHQFRLVSTQSVGANHQQYALMVSNGRLYFISGSSSFEGNGLNRGNATLPTDTWIHAAVTVSADGVRFYLDGELDLFNPVNDVLPSGYSDMVVLARRADGSGGNGIPEQLDGSLSQVGIWNRALSAEEMAALPDCPPSTISEGLIGLWLADQTPTTVVTDETGNGSDIDLTSGTVVSGPQQSCSSCTATDQVIVTFDPCYGCTDDAACNYDAAAATNDGSCEYTQEADYGLDPTLLACAPGVTLSAPAGLSGYTWSDGSTGPDLAVSESGTYTLSTSEGESTGCGLEFEQGDYASLNQPISVDSDGYALRARVHFPLPPTECPPGSAAHNQIMSSDYPLQWTPLGIRNNGQLTIYWNQNGYHWIESGYNTDALTGWHTVGVVLNGGMAEFYVDDEQVGSAAFTLPASATLQNLGNYIPTYWNSCQPIGQLDYVQLWLPDGNGQVDATPWNGVTPNHQWDLDCGNATAATQGTVDLTLQGSPEEITFNTACQSTDAVVVTINQNCVTTEFCGEGTIWDEDLGQCVPTVTDVPSAASCGAGTHWDPVTEMCIADVPGTTDENCTVMNLQELAEGYQVLLEHTADQDSIILELQDSLASCAEEGLPFDPYDVAADDACAGEDHVTFDGYDYNVVGIGYQCWFGENLRTTTYSDGTTIPNVPDNSAWIQLTSGGRCNFDNDANNVETYGRLYNWAAASNGAGLCPSGWHVPTDQDWTILENSVANSGYSGNESEALKATTGWPAGSNGSDIFGFSALPSRLRSGSDGGFNYPASSYWWSQSSNGSAAWSRSLHQDDPAILRASNNPRNGFSIRCVKD